MDHSYAVTYPAHLLPVSEAVETVETRPFTGSFAHGFARHPSFAKLLAASFPGMP